MNTYLPYFSPDAESLSPGFLIRIDATAIFSEDMYYLDGLINRKSKIASVNVSMEKDKAHIAQIKAGGIKREKALNELFDMHKNFVYRGISHHRLSEIESKEVFLDTLLAIVSAIEKNTFKGQSQLSTYLYRIFENKAKNKIRDRIRHESKFNWIHDMPVMPDKAKDMLEEMLAEEEMNWVEKFLGQMGKHCKEILIMLEFQGYSMEEIAQKLGLKSRRTVSTTKYRCLEKLKNILNTNGDINLRKTQYQEYE